MQVVWLKRDLRLHDHLPLTAAVSEGGPLLILYVMEPAVWQAGDLSVRHAVFVKEGLEELQTAVRKGGGELFTAAAAIEEVLEALYHTCGSFTLFTYEEFGPPHVYEQTKKVREWMKKHQLLFKEFSHYGFAPGSLQSKHFEAAWEEKINMPPMKEVLSFPAPPETLPQLLTRNIAALDKLSLPGERIRYGQQGGESSALETLHSFLEERFLKYEKHLLEPLASSTFSSRLSAYISWGNISLRTVYQAAMEVINSRETEEEKRPLEAFLTRLYWNSYAVQAFKQNRQAAFFPQSAAYESTRRSWNEEEYNHWLQGTTGIPMIDASMRCLRRTGWINYPARAMLVSFVTNTLRLDWKKPAHDLAKLLLDYEPGIHYSQIHQHACTSLQTIRFQDPVRQGKKHDPEGRFIRRYIEELKAVPQAYIHEPWRDPHFFYSSYPGPMTDIRKSNQQAKKIYLDAGNGSKQKKSSSREEEQLSLFDERED
ncbi:FAD-binding domain-containing protein [Alkalicoccus daliensis]|uniref:Deoxyribodipyrimidine photo-lyase n=1 Tax=Alkalicoccus daliensis TaxID=745820 RepID=A0A1H0FR66_9BACI|nr:FAD-binding domain-containing protein [Alkalicoccus daliensis]SDN97125.1 deoxyribodipyrimidine photo-lyase [Alkalicoccus daliensis]